MTSAYNQLAPLLRELTAIQEAFHGAQQSVGSMRDTSNVQVHHSFGEASIAGYEDRTCSFWEIELTAMHEGTEARWSFELELEHWHERCCISAEAGFLGKFGPAATRETEEVVISAIGDFRSEAAEMLRQLFMDLEGDLGRAVSADRHELRSFEEAGSRPEDER